MLEETEQEDRATPAGVGPTRGMLAFAVALTAGVFLVELAGGIWAGSLALLSDAAHVFTDLISLLLSYGAMVIAARPVTMKHTFGWHRAEVLAALVNGVLLCGISCYLLWEAYLRLQRPAAVRVADMLVVAIAGLLASAIIVLLLRRHAHHDINVRSAYLHVMADLAGSVGVVVAAGVMLPTGWYILDPILGLVISLAVLAGSLRLLRETSHILLEGVPASVNLTAVADAIREVPGVDDIHDLHIWTICSNLLALSVHITVGDRSSAARDEIVKAVNDTLRLHFDIVETTIQTEREPCRTDELIHLVSHREHPEGH